MKSIKATASFVKFLSVYIISFRTRPELIEMNKLGKVDFRIHF